MSDRLVAATEDNAENPYRSPITDYRSPITDY
jgi:hypothetical protein